MGDQLYLADGTSARVYRDMVVDRPPMAEPTVLVVAFRLRGIRGVGHDLFRLESMLNTPLFVGFDGFVSKLWLANDGRGTYRGLYEWDSARLAEAYARALWRVLALVSVRGSIRYHVIPVMHRDELFASVPGTFVDLAADLAHALGRESLRLGRGHPCGSRFGPDRGMQTVDDQ